MLNPKSIYRKSPAGVAEVQARALGLRAELRRLLILIDGTATTEGLIVAAVAAPPVGIGATIGKGVSASSSSGPVTIAASPPSPAPKAVGSDGLPEPTAAQVQAVRRAAIHTLHDILGPGADRLAIKIENCKDAQQMRAAVNEVRQILDQQVGAAAGQRFLNTVRGAAEGTR